MENEIANFNYRLGLHPSIALSAPHFRPRTASTSVYAIYGLRGEDRAETSMLANGARTTLFRTSSSAKPRVFPTTPLPEPHSCCEYSPA